MVIAQELDSHDHPLILHGENNPVPDDWHSCLCSACGLPIFSTPSYVCSRGCNFFLHKKCAHLPKKLEHFLHRQHPLTLVTEPPPEYGEAILFDSCVDCINCHCEPDNFIYARLSSEYCDSFLHLLCAFPLEIKILHKSHPHELISLRGESTFRCGACGDEHKGLCYLCHMCGYWLHRDCASLPNTIRHKKHGDGLHTLSLTYALPRRSSRCRYYAHVKCATEDPELYKPVSSQEIELDPNVVRFPMVNEPALTLSAAISFCTAAAEICRQHFYTRHTKNTPFSSSKHRHRYHLSPFLSSNATAAIGCVMDLPMAVTGSSSGAPFVSGATIVPSLLFECLRLVATGVAIVGKSSEG
ncbi:hypothetical protein Pfo_028185 [Paulownia fortunei]|nr:hypothetical protein Pfo_028185 [Paulownia fortunei]